MDVVKVTQDRWQICLSKEASHSLSPDMLVDCFTKVVDCVQQNEGVDFLPGRGRVFLLELENGKKGVFRGCLRGGMIQYITRSYFLRGVSLRWCPRPVEEFFILDLLCRNGVVVPRPMAAGVKWHWTRMIYQGFLVTEYIRGAENLLGLLKEKSKFKEHEGGWNWLEQLVIKTGREAGLLLRCGVYHPDLHLGNVLILNDEQVCLVDFDRCRKFEQKKYLNYYRKKMIVRWKRSITRNMGASSDLGSKLYRAFQAGINGEF